MMNDGTEELSEYEAQFANAEPEGLTLEEQAELDDLSEPAEDPGPDGELDGGDEEDEEEA